MSQAEVYAEEPRLPVARTVATVRECVAAWRRIGLKVGLVPTMGAIHEGHLSLVRRAQAFADVTIVSIFVNPTQFGPGEDFAAYPRTEAEDAAKLEAEGVDLLYAPSAAEMYPQGFSTTVAVAGLTEGLCGAFRPGHFDGVATVVAKLFTQCRPDIAVFGEKDYQQLLVVKRLARDLDLGVEIVAAPTVREADSLALSSRNAYLSPEARATARSLPETLAQAARALRLPGASASEACAGARRALVEAGFDSVDYVELRDAVTLAPLDRLDRPARLLAAARIAGTRLIDNIAVSP